MLLLTTRQELEDYANTEKKNLKRDIDNYKKKLVKEGLDHIQMVRILESSIDEKRLIKKVETRILNKISLRIYGMDAFHDAIDFVCMIDPDINCGELRKKLYDSFKSTIKREEELSFKDRGIFNDNLYLIYSTCKSRTQLTDNAIYTQISSLLNSFKIKSKTGKTFTRENVRGIITRPL